MIKTMKMIDESREYRELLNPYDETKLLCESTGYFDITGKTIFEGDIKKDLNGFTEMVIWDTDDIRTQDFDSVEIVGTIFLPIA